MAASKQPGRIPRLRLHAHPSVPVSFLFLVVLFTSLIYLVSGLSFGTCFAVGLAAACFHYASEFWHQLGHAFAARRTGYPMEGVYFWGVLGASQYPKDEGELPAQVHIRRALGGPIASLALTLAAGLCAWFLPSGALRWMAAILFLDNLLVFTLGAFLPLGFTDGGTLRYWWPRR